MKLVARYLALLGALLLGLQVVQAADGWRTYRADEFRIDLPADYVETAESRPDHLVLIDPTNTVLVEVYSGADTRRLGAAALADQVAQADRIADVTYRAEGRNWFVLSGHYRRLGRETEALIYYAKFLISPDRSRLAGFEISYPRRDKTSLDPIVTRMEKTFRRF